MNISFISNQPYPYGMAPSKRIRLFAEYLTNSNKVKIFITGKNNGINNNHGIYNGVEWTFVKFSRTQLIFGWTKIKLLLKQNKIVNDKNIIMLYDGIGLTNILFAVIGRKLGYHVFTDIVEDYSLYEKKYSFRLHTLHKINILFDKQIKFLVDGVVVISQRLLTKYLKLGLSKDKVLIGSDKCREYIFFF